MTYPDIKNLVGVTNVTIASNFRYSELRALAEKAGTMENGVLTIVVESGTLTNEEMGHLATLGRRFLSLDLTKI